MTTPINVLIVEDNPLEAGLMIIELKRAGFEPKWHRVDSEGEYLERLNGDLDLVLSDFRMPRFSGFRALELLRERGFDVPFILVSGAIGEDTAVAAMKMGAADYLLKDRLARLGSAVTQALTQCRLRAENGRTEIALRNSEKRFRALFEQAAVGVAQAEVATGRLVQVNRRFCEIAGYSQGELERLMFSAITRPQDAKGGAETARLLVTGFIREHTREERYIRKDGSEVPVSVTISAMWAPGEAPDYFIAVVQDISERKRMEELLIQAQKMEAIGTLAGGIAHDFNNILTAIAGYTELARMTLSGNPEVQAHLGSVLQASRRATDMVQKILTFGRQNAQERRPISLLPVVAEVMELLRVTIPSNIEFETAFEKDAPTVLADATQVHQVLMNLGTNSCHAMQGRTGRLRVSIGRYVADAARLAAERRFRPGTYARITVEDTGCGMDRQTLTRIFEPFFTTKPTGEGSGLGLAVVHGIMDNHGGVVTVLSRPGEGTVFELYFPAYESLSFQSEASEESVPRGSGARVLVVDDEVAIADLIQQILSLLGYAVETATRPAEALAMVRADPLRYALVLTDQTMPGMNGLLLASLIRKIRPELPVVMMTGYNETLLVDGIKAAGIRHLLLKPISIAALGTTVRAVLLDPSGEGIQAAPELADFA
jgi:PAS domain S-box-containing protein